MRDWVKDQIPWLKNPKNLISAVSPDDLKSLYKLQNDLQAKLGQPEPGHSFAVSTEIAQRALSSGASLADVHYRLSWLFWLQKFNEVGYLKFPWVDGGNVGDAGFNRWSNYVSTTIEQPFTAMGGCRTTGYAST